MLPGWFSLTHLFSHDAAPSTYDLSNVSSLFTGQFAEHIQKDGDHILSKRFQVGDVLDGQSLINTKLLSQLFRLGTGSSQSLSGVDQLSETSQKRRQEQWLGVKEVGDEGQKLTCQALQVSVEGRQSSLTYSLQVSGHVTETGETVPDLADDNFPHFHLSDPACIIGSNLPAENSLRKGAEVSSEKG